MRVGRFLIHFLQCFHIFTFKPDVDGIVGQTDRTVLIGTASKGIIDRQHQHNAQVVISGILDCYILVRKRPMV